jgi:hypothetical protein
MIYIYIYLSFLIIKNLKLAEFDVKIFILHRIEDNNFKGKSTNIDLTKLEFLLKGLRGDMINLLHAHNY